MNFIDLQKQQKQIRNQIDKHINAVLDHGKYIMGPEVQELEEKLAEFTGCKYCVTCSSGTDALLLALMAYNIGPGDAIFTTPFTFIATAEVISLLGATPIFVDINQQTFNLDPEKLKKAIYDYNAGQQITPKIPKNLKPKGIIPVDLFGLPADYDAINSIAQDHNMFVIEDAAQSFGASYKGKMAGNLTDIATTSFFPAKPLGCYGDGGAIFSNDENITNKLMSLRVHGKGSDKYDNVRIGINGRLDTIQAAILLAKLEVFAPEIEQRQRIAQRYSEGLMGSVTVPAIPDGCKSAWAQYSVLSNQKQMLIEKLKQNQVPTAVYYPKPLHLQSAFSYLGFEMGDMPISEEVSEKIFSLPMHPYLAKEDQDSIVQTIINK